MFASRHNAQLTTSNRAMAADSEKLSVEARLTSRLARSASASTRGAQNAVKRDS
jgi:hypothetical protein